jgi:hypothetical protein
MIAFYLGRGREGRSREGFLIGRREITILREEAREERGELVREGGREGGKGGKGEGRRVGGERSNYGGF